MDLKSLTGKSNIILTRRGNRSIKLALNYAKEKGYKKLFIPDQGGWITYGQYGRKLNFEINKLNTKRGIIDFDEVEKDSVVIYNDMPAYAFLQNECERDDILSIGDITGSIGMRKCKAHILVCSFGENKVINLGYGGMIASDLDIDIEGDFDSDHKDELDKKVDNVFGRMKFLNKWRNTILKDLKNFEIIKPDSEGINILVKFHDEKEKNEIIKYCEDKGFNYRLCPMEIKLLEDCISIEVQDIMENHSTE